MTHFQKTAVAVTLSSLLVACGGSGGGSDKKLTPAPTYNFTISAKVVNKCGVEQPVANVDFFLQDAQWALVSAHKTDANGQVTLTTTDQTINYTIAKEDLSGNVVSGVQLHSYIGVKSASQAIITFDNSELADNTSCECNVQSLDLSYSLVDSLVSTQSSASFTASQKTSNSSARFNNVEVCRVKTQEWPQESFMVSGLNSQGQLTAFSGFSNNFDATPTINWSLNTNAISIPLAVDHTKYQTLTTAQLLSNKLHFINVTGKNEQEAVIFDNHEFSDQSAYYGRATNTHQESISLVGKVILKSEHTRFSNQYEDTIELTPALIKPPVDTDLFSEVKPTGEYDYSDVENYPAIHLTTTVNATKIDTNVVLPAVWHVYGPSVGSLPTSDSLTGFSYIKRDINTIKNLKIELFSSDSTQSYDDYIKAFTTGTRFQTTGVFSDVKTHYIELEK